MDPIHQNPRVALLRPVASPHENPAVFLAGEKFDRVKIAGLGEVIWCSQSLAIFHQDFA